MSHHDAQRAMDNAQARQRKADALERRKRAALRVLDGGGSIQDAAEAGAADHRTVKRWRAERDGAL